MFCPAEIKKDFPIFADSDLVYLDNAATTQKPQSVLDTVEDLYLPLSQIASTASTNDL